MCIRDSHRTVSLGDISERWREKSSCRNAKSCGCGSCRNEARIIEYMDGEILLPIPPAFYQWFRGLWNHWCSFNFYDFVTNDTARSMASAKKTILGLDLNTWVFLLPALLFFAGYQLFPIVRVVWISFTDFKYLTNDPPNWIGFANYIEACLLYTSPSPRD